MNEYIYTGSKGEQIPVSKLGNSHLINALLKKTKELTLYEDGGGVNTELQMAVEALKAEVFKRLPKQS